MNYQSRRKILEWIISEMKKSALGIYVIMIVVGVIGLFFYVTQSDNPAPQVELQKHTPKEIITVAIAKRELEANSILQPDDFQIKSISVDVGSADTKFKITQPKLVNWALSSPITSGAYISPETLVEPGSDEYLVMFLQPGNVLYTFEIDASDNYLLNNLKPGQGMDIFLSYSLRQGADGYNEVVSPAHTISESRLKPLFVNKRVLAIREAGVVNKNGIKRHEDGSLLIAELQDNEVKLLKSLEGKAKIILFPSTYRPGKDAPEGNPSAVQEASWPVNNEPIFQFSAPPRPAATDVNELRG